MAIRVVSSELVKLNSNHSEDAESHSGKRTQNDCRVIDSLPDDDLFPHLDRSEDIGVVGHSEE
jgi:hypothetical protein